MNQKITLHYCNQSTPNFLLLFDREILHYIQEKITSLSAENHFLSEVEDDHQTDLVFNSVDILSEPKLNFFLIASTEQSLYGGLDFL